MSGKEDSTMRSGNRGQVIIVFVLSLLVLLGFAALAIDVGYMYSVRNDLQRSADSGALAGAYVFHDGGWVSGPVPPSLQTKAESRVRDFATRDPVNGAPLPAGAVTVTFPAINRIQVDVQDNVNLFFAGIFGSPAITLTASATALAEPVDQNVQCLVPLAFPKPLTISQGLRVTLPVAEPPSSGRRRRRRIPSNYVRDNSGKIFPLYICGDNSNSDFRDRFRNPCQDGCNAISMDDTVSPKPYPTYDMTRDEMRRLISGDPSASWDASKKLPVSTDARYSDDKWLFSPRVVRIMLYEPSEASARDAIIVRGFAGFWISDDSANVTGYFVPDSAVGNSSSSPSLTEPSLKTTRLVQ